MEKTWQRQWDASRRQDNIRKILEVLKQSQLATENDSMQSMTDMATKFEEQVFQSAESSDRYLSKIATRLAKISAKIVAPQGQQQMVHNMQPAPLHIPPGHMPVSQLGGGPQMLSQQGGGQSGGNPMLRSNSPALYAGGSPGYSSVSRGFNAQNLGSANALPMGPAGGVPITALGMGGAPPGSFGLHPDQSQRQSPGSENYGNYQQTTNQNIVRGQQQQQRQQLAAQQLKNSMPPNMNPQQQQAWMEMRKREYMQRQQQQQIMQGNQAGAQKSNQQYAQQQYLMQQQQQGGGGNTQMLTPQQQQQQQQILLQQKQLQHLQRQTQMQQGGMQASSMVASSQQRPMALGAPAAVVDPEQLWQNLQQLKAKFLEPLTNVYGQVNAQLASIANQGKPAHERSLKMLRSYADKMITTLQAQDRAQAVAMQRNFPKGLGHFEEQLVQLLSTWHKKAKPGVDSGKKAQEQQEAMAREAQALQERQKMEQEVLRKRQQQQQEQLLKQQQQQQQQQAQQRAQQHALQQSHQAAGQQQQLQQGPSGQQQQQQGGAPTKPAQQMILDQVLNAFASKANMTYQQFVKLVQTQPELRKRVALEVQKLQQRIAQQANAASLPQPTPLQTAPPPSCPKVQPLLPLPDASANTPPCRELPCALPCGSV